jgi:hypothetical protein
MALALNRVNVPAVGDVAEEAQADLPAPPHGIGG